MILTVITPFADILGEPQAPNTISNNDSQLLFGETFDVEKEHGAYVYGKSSLDGYKGYVERDQLVKEAPEANSVVISRLTHIYPEPSFKSRPLMPLSFMSRITLTGETDGEFSQTNEGEWIFSAHLQDLSSLDLGQDHVDIAMGFLGTPYLYAGRSSLGIDCSALVQMALLGAGHECPARDSKDQAETIGISINKDDLKRGDFVFFEGHVGIMVDEANILNATARHMSTLVEPLSDLEDFYKEITAIRRLS